MSDFTSAVVGHMHPTGITVLMPEEFTTLPAHSSYQI
jgi:hypothetical protein